MLAGGVCKRDALAGIEAGDKIVNVDDNLEDPQLCATIACDIYKHLRASEVRIVFVFEGRDIFYYTLFAKECQLLYCLVFSIIGFFVLVC